MVFLEGLYYISGVVIALGLIFAYNQLKAANTNIELASQHIDLLKQDMSDRHKRASVEKSLEYLQMFATDLIPSMSEYNNAVTAALDGEKRSSFSKKNKDFILQLDHLEKYQLRELVVKQELGIIHIINKLEMFSAGVLHGLADEDLVYTPVAKVFCRFIQEEYLYISISRSEGTPYKHLIDLYNKWNDQAELDELTLQKKELEDKIKEKDENLQETKKPIGVLS